MLVNAQPINVRVYVTPNESVIWLLYEEIWCEPFFKIVLRSCCSSTTRDRVATSSYSCMDGLCSAIMLFAARMLSCAVELVVYLIFVAGNFTKELKNISNLNHNECSQKTRSGKQFFEHLTLWSQSAVLFLPFSLSLSLHPSPSLPSTHRRCFSGCSSDRGVTPVIC